MVWGRRLGTSKRQMLEWILQVVLCSSMVGSLADLSLGSFSSNQAGGDTISLLVMTLLTLPRLSQYTFENTFDFHLISVKQCLSFYILVSHFMGGTSISAIMIFNHVNAKTMMCI